MEELQKAQKDFDKTWHPVTEHEGYLATRQNELALTPNSSHVTFMIYCNTLPPCQDYCDNGVAAGVMIHYVAKRLLDLRLPSFLLAV